MAERGRRLLEKLPRSLQSYQGILLHFKSKQRWVMLLKEGEDATDTYLYGFNMALGSLTLFHNESGGEITVCPHKGCNGPSGCQPCIHLKAAMSEWVTRRVEQARPVPNAMRLFKNCLLTREGIKILLDKIASERGIPDRSTTEGHMAMLASVDEAVFLDYTLGVVVWVHKPHSRSLFIEDTELRCNGITCATPGCNSPGACRSGPSTVCVDCFVPRPISKISTHDVHDTILNTVFSAFIYEQLDGDVKDRLLKKFNEKKKAKKKDRKDKKDESSREEQLKFLMNDRDIKNQTWDEVIKKLFSLGSTGFNFHGKGQEFRLVMLKNMQLRIVNYASSRKGGSKRFLCVSSYCAITVCVNRLHPKFSQHGVFCRNHASNPQEAKRLRELVTNVEYGREEKALAPWSDMLHYWFDENVKARNPRTRRASH